MHTETERKFLVKNDGYKAEAVRSSHIRQGYIAHDGGNTVRIRIKDGQGILTIKGATHGFSRPEWEMEIPLQDATDLFALCKFLGDNEGLVMAEIELGSEDEAFVRPDWLGEEVTGDRRYYNSYLSARPFKTW